MQLSIFFSGNNAIQQALASTALLAFASCAHACDGGPDYCSNDGRIPAALAQKKSDLTHQGYPARLIGLLDLGVQCVARIRQEPNGFTVIDVADDTHKVAIAWDADEESTAANNLKTGQSQRYWIVNSRHAFQCDGQLPFDQQAGYDVVDDLNANGAIKCVLQGGNVRCTR